MRVFSVFSFLGRPGWDMELVNAMFLSELVNAWRKSDFVILIVQYTEFNHFSTDVISCVFTNDAFRIVAEFRFCLTIKGCTNDHTFSGFECFEYWWKIFVEGTDCFRFLHRGFEGRCISTYDIGYSAVIWFNFYHVCSLGDWCEINFWAWSYEYPSSCNWFVFMTSEV